MWNYFVARFVGNLGCNNVALEALKRAAMQRWYYFKKGLSCVPIAWACFRGELDSRVESASDAMNKTKVWSANKMKD